LWPERFDPCRRDGGQTACFVGHQREYLTVWGLVPAASLRDQGVQLRRAMFRDDYGRFQPAVELRRRPGESPVVLVYVPRRPNGTSTASPAMAAPVPETDWQALSGANADFDRLPPPPTSRVNGDEIAVCAHSWLIFVEYTDPAGRPALRRRVEPSCFESAAADYADRLAGLAIRALPQCAAIEINRHPAAVLDSCASFTGDTMAAAAAYNRFVLLAHERAGVAEVQALFADRATLEWSGFPPDQARPAEQWATRLTGLSANPLSESIVGEGPGRAVLRGVLRRWAEDPPPNGGWLQAPLEIIWVRDGAEPFRIGHISVGAFEPLPGLCPPGLLTGAERANNCHW
jgi:hypothetical protein